MALKKHVAFVPNSVLVTLLRQALGTRSDGVADRAQGNQQALGAHPEAQRNMEGGNEGRKIHLFQPPRAD